MWREPIAVERCANVQYMSGAPTACHTYLSYMVGAKKDLCDLLTASKRRALLLNPTDLLRQPAVAVACVVAWACQLLWLPHFRVHVALVALAGLVLGRMWWLHRPCNTVRLCVLGPAQAGKTTIGHFLQSGQKVSICHAG